MNASGFGFILLITLTLVPLISRIAGRLDSLAIDFLGSAVSLLVSFADIAYGKSTGAHTTNIESIIAYVFICGIGYCSLCLMLNNAIKSVRVERRIQEGRWGGLYPEAMYWLNSIAAIVFLIFSFNMNFSANEIIANTEAKSLFATIYAIFLYQLGSFQIFYLVAFVVGVCAVARYSYIPHEYLKRHL